MNTVEEIKQRLDIVTLISEYVKPLPSGKNFKALCPFHPEKDPSFFIFPEQQRWHCFGACGTGGDIFTFIMKKEGLDFGQALHLLADKAGVNVEVPGARDKELEDKKDRLIRANEAAASYYHHVLLHTPTGANAKDYLLKRGISLESVTAFQLGYSPDRQQDLKQHLKTEGFDETDLIETGILVKRDDGTTYDRFHNRIIFPIRNIKGRVTGFGARVLDDSLPKYVNTPQTPVFDKSSSLYSIDKAKTTIQKNNLAIITEGYFDVITSHQYGWDNTIASMGTALTGKQLSTIKKYTKNIVLALDADTAGEEALLRSTERFDLQETIVIEDHLHADIKVAVPAHGKDPDDAIRNDPQSWSQSLDNATPLIDFVIEVVTNNTNLESAGEKFATVEKLIPLLIKLDNPINRDSLYDEIKRNMTKQRKRSTMQKDETVSSAAKPGPHALEEHCLALLLQFSELRSGTDRLLPEYFERTENREIFQKWQQYTKLSTMKKNLDTTLHEHLQYLLSESLPPKLHDNEELQRKDLNICIVRLQERWLRNLEQRKAELLAEMKEIPEQIRTLEEQGTEKEKELKQVFTLLGHQRHNIQ
jgi:DNA primase